MNTFPIFTNQGHIHPCYPSSKRFKNCADASDLPRTECFDFKMDYLNCLRNDNLMENRIKRDSNQDKILSIPSYDLETDQFKDIEGNVIEPPK